MSEVLIEVEVSSFESIVRGGVRKVTWHVEQEQTWVSARTIEGASCEDRDSGPGVVWEQCTRLRLARGTRLMRVESAPSDAAPRDPLEYLWDSHRKSSRKMSRHFFRVEPGGRLRRIAPPSGPASRSR